MAEPVDPDDLIDAGVVADVLGLSSRNAVSVYRARYPDFPRPRINRGTCVLWLRQEIEGWSQRRR